MPSDSGIPSLYSLQQPEKLTTVLKKEDKFEDCLTCMIMGGATFIGLGAYSYFSGMHHLEQQRASILKSTSRFGFQSRQAGIVGIAVSFVGLGLYRFIN